MTDNLEYKCFDNKESKIINYIDSYFEKLALELGAETYHIPALINSEILKKCGYFSSFPHHLTLASYYDPDSYNTIANSGIIENKKIINSDLFFTPAACLHIYPMLEHQKFTKKIITTKARVYRFENYNFDGKTRLWDFTVREIVFVGSPDFVKNKLEEFKIQAIKLAKMIGLQMQLNKASDHFYPSKFNEMKGKLQLSNSLKDELVCIIDEKPVALASFNTHGFHFSKTFNFDNNGQIVTGCVGFGLERWIAAIKSQNLLEEASKLV